MRRLLRRLVRLVLDVSAIWRRVGELTTQGVPFSAAMRQARQELDPDYWTSGALEWGAHLVETYAAEVLRGARGWRSLAAASAAGAPGGQRCPGTGRAWHRLQAWATS